MLTLESEPPRPKRVILRIRLNIFSTDPTNSDFSNIISTFLTFQGRLSDEKEKQKHYVHIEPLQDPEVQQASFHMVIDMEALAVPDALLSNMPHEFYRVARDHTSHDLCA